MMCQAELWHRFPVWDRMDCRCVRDMRRGGKLTAMSFSSNAVSQYFDGLLAIKIENVFPSIPSLVRDNQLPRLLIDKVTIIVRVSKSPDLDQWRNPARLLLKVRHKRRLHSARVFYILRVVDFRRGCRAVVGEHDYAAMRFVLGDGLDLGVKPGQISLVRGIMFVDGPVDDVGEVGDEKGHGAALFVGYVREECAAQDCHLGGKVKSSTVEENESAVANVTPVLLCFKHSSRGD